MSGISLTAPMRSTLLSLQNIARQQDIVQNRLATGLKVSSAIDNPSAYYTAASLSNRAADLSALLDAMSQGVQTIKTASEAITSATKFLEQAKATANQALETSEPIVAKVSTEEELLAAVESGGRGFIVLSADISLTQTLELKDGQKLVGDNYFSSTPGANRTISFNFDGFTDDGIRLGDNGLVANLNINYETNSNVSRTYAAIHAFGSQNAEIKNVSISLSNDTGLPYLYGIYTNNSALAKLSGNINIQGTGARVGGIANYGEATLNIQAKVNLDTTTFSLKTGDGSSEQYSATTNILDSSEINIHSTSHGIITYAKSALNITNAKINSTAKTHALYTTEGSRLSVKDSELNLKSEYAFWFVNAAGNVFNSIINAESTTTYALSVQGTSEKYSSAGELNIDGKSILNLKTIASRDAIYVRKTVNKGQTSLSIAKGAVININRGASGMNAYSFIDDYNITLSTVSTSLISSFGADKANQSAGQDLPAQAPSLPDMAAEMAKDFSAEKDEDNADSQYGLILEQFDMLISDASYKGINLLQGQNLKINFNEDRSSMIEVPGYDVNTESLGLVTKEWETKEDIEKSISELESAVSTLRSFASAFGNYYSIVTTRQDFTENLINVLEEGADKLTLADMNEESANMLALQTSQQLAINSLSLASQAAQSVLKLF